jgi:hypothetical protein
VFVSGQYGKSKISGAYSINSKGQLFVYHTLPEITSVSPNVGGSEGGTHVTIQGNSFDSFPGKTQVMLGSTPCEIVSVTSAELVCSTPAEGDVSGATVGGRGLLYEIWTETEDATIADTSAGDYNSMTIDGSTVEGHTSMKQMDSQVASVDTLLLLTLEAFLSTFCQAMLQLSISALTLILQTRP